MKNIAKFSPCSPPPYIVRLKICDIAPSLYVLVIYIISLLGIIYVKFILVIYIISLYI